MNAKLPLVSVVMPVYNVELYIEESIQSILNQTFADFEFIIFNDGSTDRCNEIINAIKDERIIFIDDKENVGYVKRLNDGLQMARGKYIARMDSDDIALPERFAKQVALLDAHPEIGICGTSFKAFGSFDFIANMPVSDYDIRAMMLVGNPLGHPTVMMRQSVIQQYKLSYDRDMMPVEDYWMWYEFSKVTQLHNLPDILLKYRRHAEQVSIVQNTRQRARLNEIRLAQILDKGFKLSKGEQAMYCNVLDMSVAITSVHDFISVLNLVNKIIKQNRQLQAFDEKVLVGLFSPRWRVLINSISRYSPVYIWPVLLGPDFKVTSLSAVDKIRFLIKSMLFWKVKVS